MNSKKNNRRSLFYSVISLLLCISMLLGTTMAWFTDSVSSTGNIIKTGRLKVAMEYTDNLSGEWKDASNATIFEGNIWEPGYSDMQFIRVSNTGNLAFQYQMHILPAVQAADGEVDLADVIDVYLGKVDGNFTAPTAFAADMAGMSKLGTLAELMEETPATSVLLPVGAESTTEDVGSVTYCIVLHMQETAGNEYQNLTVGNNFTVQLVASQVGHEQDAFGNSYDASAEYPELVFPEMIDMDMGSADVTVDSGNKLTEDVILTGTAISATVKAGTLLNEGTTKLVLTVEEKDDTDSNITLGENEELRALDVHVSGIAANNTVPVIISLGKVAPEFLNQGNLTLAHVENGQTVLMTQVMDLAELDAHNEFYYDVIEGELTVAMATFSEVAVVAEPAKWEGGVDHSWYVGKTSPYTIANADQLWSFSQIVGGMAKDEEGKYIYTVTDSEGNEYHNDSFSGESIKLIADINLGDKESENNPDIIFYPIGYWNNEGTYERLPADQRKDAVSSGLRNFEGTFDGNGHTISNFYHNTWEMKGDHDWYSTITEQYYRDGMGLFGRIYKGTVKNLTVKNFSSDGEIATTGVIAAYADGATFENIAIFGCNPRVYNIGNGGIVGCVGWYAKEAGLETTFKNITVDNSNKISALWGSYDVACGGLVGQYYPTSGQSSAGTPKNGGIEMVNCHVSAIMDVYNDVCANYQYYAYRYAGMLIGSIRENVTGEDGHVYPDMTGITASGCTVNYGEWNHYYYCELVANSLASYTHDHQFSRLQKVDKLPDSASGTAHYYVKNADGTITCRHFIDGKLHKHEDSGKEVVDGVEVLKEDKQRVYLPFVDQLFTGYGWGVTSKGVKDFEGIETIDVAFGDKEESVEKFKGIETVDLSAIKAGDTVSIADLFTAAESGVEIKNDNVVVAVTDLTYTGITAEFTRGTTWNEGSLKFNGTNGMVKITIQDYYFCTPTSIIVTVGEFKSTDRFTYKFPNVDKYLYRVGNQNEFSISSLFGVIEAEAENIGNVTITVSKADEKYTYTDGTSWNADKIDFDNNFTGPVEITISDDKYSTPLTLNLEVVEATNNETTTAPTVTANSVVLLNDVSGSFSVSGGNTLYGNGFEVTLPKTYQAGYTAGYVGYVTMSGGNLDNVRIVGPVYPEMNIYQKQAQNSTANKEEYFYNSILINKGNNTISNSYISGSRTAVCIRGGNNVVIEDTTLSGGAVANMQIAGASKVTLRDLTTVQVDETDSYGQGVTAHGMGVYVDSGTTEIVIEGELQQYNWLSRSQWKSVVGDYESSFPYFYDKDTYKIFQHKRGNDIYVNMAFVFACNWETDGLIVDNQTNKATYQKMDNITVSGYTGGVYATANQSNVSDDMYNAPEYESEKFNPVAPVFNFDNTENDDADDEGNAADSYCVYDADTGVMRIGMTGTSKTLDLSGATVTKDGTVLSYTAYLNGTQISGDSITISADAGTKQTLMFKASTNAGYDKDGNEISGTVEYTWTISLEVATLSYPAPVWTIDGYTSGTTTYKVGTTNCYYVYYQTSQGYGEAVPIYDGIKVRYYNGSGVLTNLDLSSTQYKPTDSTQPLNTDFTYKLDDDSILTMSVTGSYKSGVSTLYFTNYNNKTYAYPSGLDSDSCVRPSKTGYDFNVSIKYTFTDPNGLSTETITMNWYGAKANGNNITSVQWKDFDSKNGKEPECLAEGTLITMADGTQKPVEELNVGDMVLAFNHVTGQFEPAPIIFNNHADQAEADLYDVLHLEFSNGEEVKIVGAHGFFNMTLMQYVYVDYENYADFIGHEFYYAGNDGTVAEKVVLENAYIEEELVRIYCPVTYFHMNSIANGFLNTPNIPGGITGLVNYFEYDPDLKYNEEAMQRDIEKYGLYTYDDFSDYISEAAYHSSPSVYLKVAVGKGMITYEQIIDVINYLLAGSLID